MGIVILWIFAQVMSYTGEVNYINCYIWGAVRTPGAYKVRSGANLMEAISHAGGPTEYADISRIKLIRAGSRRSVMKINLKRYLKKGKKSLPIVEEGDVIIVPTNRYYALRELMPYFTFISVILNVIQFVIGVRSGE